MADRYQARPFPADAPPRSGDSDPLAELARLIGQTDPFAANSAPQPPAAAPAFRKPAPPIADEASFADDAPAPRVPTWMQHRANLRPPAAAAAPARAAQHDYAAAHYGEHPAYEPARYDEALYGPQPSADAEPQDYGEAYPEPPPYGDHDGYPADEPVRKPQSRGLMMAAGIVALAIVGTGGAYAYRTYIGGGARSGEAPVIKADPTPTKIAPPSAAEGGKPIQDRLAASGSVEALISREEQPIDPRNPSAGGPRVVLPPLNPAAPSAAATAPARPAASIAPAADEPRRIKTLSVKPDQPDQAAQPTPRVAAAPPARQPAAAPAAAPVRPQPPANANAAANAPLSLAPQASPPETRPSRVAAAPTATASVGGAGGYVVQVSSQRSEADAQASYRSLQTKFPNVLGSRAPLIKRADLGDKGVYYRATVGPFGTPEEAAQLCNSLKSAGGQCVVQRN